MKLIIEQPEVKEVVKLKLQADLEGNPTLYVQCQKEIWHTARVFYPEKAVKFVLPQTCKLQKCNEGRLYIEAL